MTKKAQTFSGMSGLEHFVGPYPTPFILSGSTYYGRSLYTRRAGFRAIQTPSSPPRLTNESVLTPE